MIHSLFIIAYISIIILDQVTFLTSIVEQEAGSVIHDEPKLGLIKDNVSVNNTNYEELDENVFPKPSFDKVVLNSYEPHIEDVNKEEFNKKDLHKEDECCEEQSLDKQSKGKSSL